MRTMILAIFIMLNLEGAVFHQKEVTDIWTESEVSPFDELMLTWNAKRPLEGTYNFYVSVKVGNQWSNFLPYATWGSQGQKGSVSECDRVPAKVHQDAVLVREGQKGTGFRIKVEGPKGNIQGVFGLHVYTNGEEKSTPSKMSKPIFLDVKGLSQVVLDHPRNMSLCSPTSTTAVLNYLTNKEIEPISFAERVWDGQFDIYGNWVFNVVEASNVLGPTWDAWVERLDDFSGLYKQLEKGFPVVVSIKAPLPGSGTRGNSGHLIVVRGFDPKTSRVFCMDPGLEGGDKTAVSFSLDDFQKAWARRGNIAYIFQKKGPTSVFKPFRKNTTF